MSSKLYVGNLSYKTTEETLTNLFSQVGQVLSSVIIKDKVTYESRGFGFVEMNTPEEAEAAIGQLNGYSIDGRAIVVSPARERSDSPSRGRFSGRGGGGQGGRGQHSGHRGGGQGGRRERQFSDRREQKGWWNS
jgi:RNA recognition motif-containing protein